MPFKFIFFFQWKKHFCRKEKTQQNQEQFDTFPAILFYLWLCQELFQNFLLGKMLGKKRHSNLPVIWAAAPESALIYSEAHGSFRYLYFGCEARASCEPKARLVAKECRKSSFLHCSLYMPFIIFKDNEIYYF